MRSLQMPSKNNNTNKQVNVWGMTEVILTSWCFCLWGNCNRCAHPVHPGHHGQKEYRRSKRHGASVHRPDHHGHRSVHGSELRLSHQPRTRPRPTLLHSCGRLGHGSIQVIVLVLKSNSNLYEPYSNYNWHCLPEQANRPLFSAALALTGAWAVVDVWHERLLPSDCSLLSHMESSICSSISALLTI